MPEKKKLLFLIPTLEVGGAQRVLSILLKLICKEQFDIILCVLTDTGVFYEDVPTTVQKIYLRASRVRYSLFKIYTAIRKTKPDLVFVFDVNHLNLIVGLLSFALSKRIKYVTREAVILSEYIRSYQSLKNLRTILYKLTFKRFDMIICQSNYMREDLVKNFKVPSKKIVVINNPIDVDSLITATNENTKVFNDAFLNIIAVGRIVHVKGYDLLLKALTYVKAPNVRLTILGEETLEDPGYLKYLTDLVLDYGLSSKVTFLGYIENPHLYVKESKVLVVSSRTEAFSNAAIEANAIGTPVIAFNSPGGMSEIIEQGFNGWLVENGNVVELAKAIDQIACVEVNRSDIAQFTRGKYDAKKLIMVYEKVLMEVC